MTGDASGRTHDRQAERAELLEILDDGMEICLYKLPDPDRDRHAGRITDASKEQARSKWLNTLAKLAREKRMLLRDQDLDELSERLEELERARDTDAPGEVPIEVDT